MAQFSVKLVDGVMLVGNVPTPQLEIELARAHQRAGAKTFDHPGSSHAIYLSQPEAVATVIRGAIRGVSNWNKQSSEVTIKPVLKMSE